MFARIDGFAATVAGAETSVRIILVLTSPIPIFSRKGDVSGIKIYLLVFTYCGTVSSLIIWCCNCGITNTANSIAVANPMIIMRLRPVIELLVVSIIFQNFQY